MSYLTKRQLFAAFKAGQLDTVAKQVLTYGSGLQNKDWDCIDGTPKRRSIAMHHGHQWKIEKHKGEIHSVGFAEKGGTF
jgi:hypothetical protein